MSVSGVAVLGILSRVHGHMWARLCYSAAGPSASISVNQQGGSRDEPEEGIVWPDLPSHDLELGVTDHAECGAGIITCGDMGRYDLDGIRHDLSGSYVLMRDLDSTTAGYEELTGPNASEGKGWEPIGTEDEPFVGSFDGRGYGISDLFIDRQDELTARVTAEKHTALGERYSTL